MRSCSSLAISASKLSNLTRPGHAAAGKPGAEFLVQGRTCELARQRVVGQPAAEPDLGRLVERGNRKVVDDGHPVPAPAAARPGVAVQRIGAYADLGSKVDDRRRRDVRLLVGKAAVLAPERELGRRAELACVNPPGQRRQVLRPQRPALAQLVRRPQPLHPLPPCRTQAGNLTGQKQNTSPRCPKRTASRSLAHVALCILDFLSGQGTSFNGNGMVADAETHTHLLTLLQRMLTVANMQRSP